MTSKPKRSDAVEKQAFEESLHEHGQLAEEDCDPLPPGTTHQVETDDHGERQVRRKRFSAF